MGVFKEICELRELSGRALVLYVKQTLIQAISSGWVEQVPVMKPNRFHPDEEWYRDKETGEIYRSTVSFRVMSAGDIGIESISVI